MPLEDNRSFASVAKILATPLCYSAPARAPANSSGDRATNITTVTKLTADEKCFASGGVLVPPELTSVFVAPPGADYVCLSCGRPYQWTTGNPPRLTVMVIERRGENDDED